MQQPCIARLACCLASSGFQLAPKACRLKHDGDADGPLLPLLRLMQAPLIGITPLGVISGGERLRGIDTSRCVYAAAINSDVGANKASWKKYGYESGMTCFGMSVLRACMRASFDHARKSACTALAANAAILDEASSGLVACCVCVPVG